MGIKEIETREGLWFRNVKGDGWTRVKWERDARYKYHFNMLNVPRIWVLVFKRERRGEWSTLRTRVGGFR